MNRGWSLPIIEILILIIAILTYFFGWIVLVYVAVIVVAIPVGTAIYDRISHDTKCRWCNAIKDIIVEDGEISFDQLETKHLENLDTHMIIRVYIDGEPDVIVDIDYNETIIGILPAETDDQAER